jgi:hypothetical protein
MPDTAPSTTIGESSVNRSEYALLGARYLEPRERSGVELPMDYDCVNKQYPPQLTLMGATGYSAL